MSDASVCRVNIVDGNLRKSTSFAQLEQSFVSRLLWELFSYLVMTMGRGQLGDLTRRFRQKQFKATTNLPNNSNIKTVWWIFNGNSRVPLNYSILLFLDLDSKMCLPKNACQNASRLGGTWLKYKLATQPHLQTEHMSLNLQILFFLCTVCQFMEMRFSWNDVFFVKGFIMQILHSCLLCEISITRNCFLMNYCNIIAEWNCSLFTIVTWPNRKCFSQQMLNFVMHQWNEFMF